MIRNHFKTAWRNLMKHKTFSFINVAGLTIGLTSFLLVSLYIFDELTFDRFFTHSNNIYRIVESSTSPEGKANQVAYVGYPVSESAAAQFPEIQKVARISYWGRVNMASPDNMRVIYGDFMTASSAFLQVFDFPLLQGNPATALNAPHTVVVTETGARKLFGTTDVLGKTIRANRVDSLPYLITGVLKDLPVNTQFSFDHIFSEATLIGGDKGKKDQANWNANEFVSFALLDNKARPQAVEAKLNQLVAANRQADNKSGLHLTLQPLKNIHFYSDNIEGNLGKTGSLAYMYVFSIIALFVLLIACINYINLTTARFTNRAKEIGVRKVAGASRYNLAGQFMAEALLVILVGLTLALVLVKACLPAFNAFTEKQLALDGSTDHRIWIGVIGAAITAALLSGVYPAFFQSRLRPVLLLKSKLPAAKGSIPLRRGLVVFQFALSIIMIIATMVVYQQMKYVSTKDMGFNKTQLLVVDINSRKIGRSSAAIKSEFARLPQVQAVSVSSRVPGEWKSLPKIKVRNEHTAVTEGNDMYYLGVDESFLSTYQIKLLQGRNFREGKGDSLSVIINETAARELGITTPGEQLLDIPMVNFGGDPEEVRLQVKVVGIVKDFNFQSLHTPLAPMVLGFTTNPIHGPDYFTARIAAGNTEATMAKMNTIFRSIDPEHLFEYHFLDKQWELFYREDRIRETIFLLAAVLAILIACLGLFGLATYAAEQRVKEIGIRKVLGASSQRIVAMLSRDFLQLVLIAALIAFPVAWLAMERWLQDFAYRIHLNWWTFLLAGLIAMLIALVTVSMKAVKAAVANPVKSLRAE